MADKKPSPLYVNQPDYGSSKGYNSSLGNTGTQPLMKGGEGDEDTSYPPPNRKRSPLYDRGTAGKTKPKPKVASDASDDKPAAKIPLPPERPKDLGDIPVPVATKPTVAPDNQAPVMANKDVLGRGGRRY